jgi:undecaprenyl-diphosphatase
MGEPDTARRPAAGLTDASGIRTPPRFACRVAVVAGGVPVTVVVLLFGACVALAMTVASRVSGPRTASLAPEAVDHWLVERAARHRRLGRAATVAHHRVVGGVVVAAGLALVWAVALFVGWTLDSIRWDSGIARWDDSVARWGAAHATAASTDVLTAVTHSGDIVVVLLVMAVVATFDLVRRRNGDVVLFLATVGVGVTIVHNTLKMLVDRERPPVLHLADASGSSFPSGHSATAAAGWAAIALVIARSSPRRVRPFLAAAATGVALAVAASRALLGVHWLTDVVAGLAIGWTWFLLVSLAFGGRLLRLGATAPSSPAAADSRAGRGFAAPRAGTTSRRPGGGHGAGA